MAFLLIGWYFPGEVSSIRASFGGIPIALALLVGPTGCNASTGVQAGGALAVVVAATAIHRAATGDCWGRCSAGYVCNQESGFCEAGECRPKCEAGYSCITHALGMMCEPTKNAAFASTVVGPQVTVWGQTPSVTDPNTQVAQPPRAAGGLTPARAGSGQVQIPRAADEANSAP